MSEKHSLALFNTGRSQRPLLKLQPELDIKQTATKDLVEYLQMIPEIKEEFSVKETNDVSWYLDTLEKRLSRVVRAPALSELKQMQADLSSFKADLNKEQSNKRLNKFLKNYGTCLNTIIENCESAFRKKHEKKQKTKRPNSGKKVVVKEVINTTRPITSGRRPGQG